MTDRSDLTSIDRVIHEPARLLVISILSGIDSADFLYLQRETGLTKGNLSTHLTKLETAGYISINKTYRGKIPLTLCAITDEGKSAYNTYRQQLRQLFQPPSAGGSPKEG